MDERGAFQAHDTLDTRPAGFARPATAPPSPEPGSLNAAARSRAPADRARESKANDVGACRSAVARLTCSNSAASTGLVGAGSCEPTRPGSAPRARKAVSAALATVMLGRIRRPPYTIGTPNRADSGLGRRDQPGSRFEP